MSIYSVFGQWNLREIAKQLHLCREEIWGKIDHWLLESHLSSSLSWMGCLQLAILPSTTLTSRILGKSWKTSYCTCWVAGACSCLVYWKVIQILIWKQPCSQVVETTSLWCRCHRDFSQHPPLPYVLFSARRCLRYVGQGQGAWWDRQNLLWESNHGPLARILASRSLTCWHSSLACWHLRAGTCFNAFLICFL